jgi:transcription-repair coupling factor (superfamily II helicase)
MGGSQKKKQTEQLRKNAQMTLAQNARLSRQANRIAVRQAGKARKQSAAQNAALVAAEKETARMMAQVGQEKDLRTEVIDDEDEARKKLLSMGGKSAYGFSRPSGSGLGGGSSTLG